MSKSANLLTSHEGVMTYSKKIPGVRDRGTQEDTRL